LVKPPFLLVQPLFLLVESPLVSCPVPPPAAGRLSLFLAAIHGSKGSMASGGLGVLTTHANAWDRGTGFPMVAATKHGPNAVRTHGKMSQG